MNNSKESSYYDPRKIMIYNDEGELIEVGIAYNPIVLLDELEIQKDEKVVIVKATKKEIENDII